MQDVVAGLEVSTLCMTDVPRVGTALVGTAPVMRRLETSSATYPAWFFLDRLEPELTGAQDAEIRRAVQDGWRAWSASLDAAVAA